ncbi:SsrA-binding protein SmpB [Ruminococcaceae bacterium OttesenSCG-928-O06]|nr:SsrA-binding protein SmpB [Ruminococcaceae bacterium OttesenSCG-928-O06]
MVPTKTVAVNRKARHEYIVLETVEAGIELVGTEVKSIRMGNVNLKEAWADVRDGEVHLVGMHISPYEKGNIFNRDPERKRKLLLHKSEIRRLYQQVKTQGLTLIPLSLYLKGSLVKVELGLCRGKKLYDKRATAANRDAKRTMDRAVKQQNAE